MTTGTPSANAVPRGDDMVMELTSAMEVVRLPSSTDATNTTNSTTNTITDSDMIDTTTTTIPTDNNIVAGVRSAPAVLGGGASGGSSSGVATTSTAVPIAAAVAVNHRPYDDVVAAGPPADPIDFPRPMFERGRRAEVLCYHPRSQTHQQLQNVLFRDFSHEFPEDGDSRVTRAYWPLPYKKPMKTIMGKVEICLLLTRGDTTTGGDEDGDSSSSSSGSEEDDDVVFQSTTTLVAVKVNFSSRMDELRDRHAEDPLKEIAAMQLIGNDHPNVIGAIEVLFDGSNLNVVMPYCDNGDLFEILQESVRGPNNDLPGMSEDVARYWFRQIISGIEHLHSRGICHRDISPENVMINGNGCLIIDMGMCLRIPFVGKPTITDIQHGGKRRLLIKPQGACGKLPYMAPEIYRNRDPFDGCAIDVWTAGTILFCMVTGNRSYQIPHHTDQQFYWMTRGLDQLLEDWNVALSPEGYHILHNMLQIDPRNRLTIPEIQNHPWFTNHPATATDVANANNLVHDLHQQQSI